MRVKAFADTEIHNVSLLASYGLYVPSRALAVYIFRDTEYICVCSIYFRQLRLETHWCAYGKMLPPPNVQGGSMCGLLASWHGMYENLHFDHHDLRIWQPSFHTFCGFPNLRMTHFQCPSIPRGMEDQRFQRPSLA